MKFKKFEIQNYRAIEHIEVELNHQILPIIGVNESGKTSILQAILSFDKGQDKVNNGQHLEYENRYAGIKKQECNIIAHILLKEDDFEKLFKSLKIKSNNPIFDTLNGVKKSKTPIIITRVLSSADKQYKLLSPKIEDEAIEKKILNYITKNQPFILYFDDFTDRVPPEIPFKEDYKDTGKIPGRKNVEWQYIIEEIFNRSEVDGFEDLSEKPLQIFMKIEDKDKRDDLLSDITAVLEKNIIEEWKTMKKKGLNKLADDSDNLEISISYNDEKYEFEFKVKDKANKGKQRTFNISHRSKGFQWFFNYMVKLKFNPKYNDDAANSIYLLDEPGSYLHSSAQQELLKNLCKVSETNNLIYCTHSHYLLNPNSIKLGSIRIAEKQDSKITLINYGNYKGKDLNGALSPVYQALQLNITNDFIGKIVLFEGITDFYFFSIIQQNSQHLNKKVRLIPGQGSGNSSTMIAFALSFSDDFLIAFDNDKGYNNGIKKYKRLFGEGIIKKSHKYSNSKNSRLEDLLSKEDSKYITDSTNTKDLKKGFGLFFYDHKDKHSDFVNSLSKESLENCNRTFEKINNLEKNQQ